MRSRKGSLMKVLAGLLALLVGELLFAPTARASCGSYVHISSEKQQATRLASSAKTGERSPVRPAPGAPCTGPLCSSPDEMPVPYSSAPRSAESWACLGALPQMET